VGGYCGGGAGGGGGMEGAVLCNDPVYILLGLIAGQSGPSLGTEPDLGAVYLGEMTVVICL
jgi:hypothetical protein